jgi:hypothetical protein
MVDPPAVLVKTVTKNYRQSTALFPRQMGALRRNDADLDVSLGTEPQSRYGSYDLVTGVRDK